jgi:hypothetical protein
MQQQQQQQEEEEVKSAYREFALMTLHVARVSLPAAAHCA